MLRMGCLLSLGYGIGYVYPIDHYISLDEAAFGELNSSVAETLLNAIDELRELQVGDIRSVLEVISGLSFPTKGDVCTRFATELVIRRAPETKINVRIIAHGSGSSQQFHRTSFNKNSRSEIINEATSAMGIRQGGSKGFSRDVLRIELSDPDVVSLTLVDLPGFFHSATEDQSRADKKLVRMIANQFMAQPKSIILAVMAANNNLANQKVVDAAMEHDRNRERTLDEKKCLKLAKNQESVHKLKLGWHVLRNRPEGRENISSADRNAEEESFFKREHIKKTLPSLVKEIDTNLSTSQRDLEKLGRPREKTEDLRAYILDIAEKFQQLARDGVEGRYSNDFFGDLDSSHEARKLWARIRRLNSVFHVTLVTKGVDRKIYWEGDRLPFQEEGISWIRDGEDTPEYLEPYLDLFAQFVEPTETSEEDLSEELEKLAAANQGTEFPGLPKGDLVFQLFEMQVRPWSGIADFYLEQVLSYTRTFVEELFTHVIGADEQTIRAITIGHVENFFEEKQNLLRDKSQEIFRPYALAYGPPIDVDFHRFHSSVARKRDAERVTELVEECFPSVFTERGERNLTRRQDESSEFGIEKIIDMMETHFQISLKTFSQNVVNLVAENCLISDLHTIITPSIVVQMSDDRLKELSSESEDIQSKRQVLQHEIDILRAGQAELMRCRRSRPSQRTGAAV
ncbi:P-loop containing nucleoside triphosphate hydrolase protein [Xylaria venustula]|nr:P-loop containing nucleoside triphosphate hydrolase protein [Xylaria venustula]